jgi:hypothetical protein
MAGVGDALLEDAEGLEVERPLHAVDDEARRVGRHDRRLGQPSGEQRDAVDDLGRRHRPGDDLDERHQRHGVEEMHPDDALGMLGGRRDLRDRQRAGVRGEDRLGGRIGVEPPEGVALELQLLGNGLDDDVGACELADLRDRADATASGSRIGLGELALLGLALQEAPMRSSARSEAPSTGSWSNTEARLGRHLGDAGAHDAGPEHADGGDLGHRPRNAGSRFSVKAATPSAWSSVAARHLLEGGLGRQAVGQAAHPRRRQ